MLGLSLSKQFYEKEFLPIIAKELPDLLPKVAIGLVGEGSECFGYDDEYSQDHDFGASICLWLPENEIALWHTKIATVINRLPQEFCGFKTRYTQENSSGRCGLMGIENFYARYIGMKTAPKTWQEWRNIPEHFLATATNGTIFHDERKIFTDFREALLAYYPEDIRLKKIAARCAIMAQAGQYNLLRSAKRKENTTSMLCIARFAEAALSLVFLLNKKYMPFYKWANKGVQFLPLLGEDTALCLEKLNGLNANYVQTSIEVIEQYATLVSQVLQKEGYSTINDSWLLAHATQIQSKISIPQLRALPEMAE